jgi:hypothetical protein
MGFAFDSRTFWTVIVALLVFGIIAAVIRKAL